MRYLRWSFAEQVAQYAVSLVTFFAVARLIGPAHYGLFAVAYAPVALVQSFLTRGAGDFLFSEGRAEYDGQSAAVTLFWVTTLIGAILTVLILILAALFRGMEHLSDSSLVMIALAPLCMMSGAIVVPTALLERDFQFRVLAIRTFASGVISSVGSIGAAYAGAGAWSLVIQLYISQGLALIIVIAISQWRPSLNFDRNIARSIAPRLSSNTSSNSIMASTLFIPRILVGYTIGPAGAGFLTAAQRIYQLLIQICVYPSARVMFACCADQAIERRFHSFNITALLTLIILIPVTLYAYLIAPMLVPLMFGDAWADAATVIAVFQIALLPVGCSILLHALVRSLNLQHRLLPIQIVEAALIVATYVFFIARGLEYVLWISCVIFAASWLAQLVLVQRLTEFSLARHIITLSAVLPAGCMLLGLILAGFQLARSPFETFGVMTVSLLVYVISILITLRVRFSSYQNLVGQFTYGLNSPLPPRHKP